MDQSLHCMTHLIPCAESQLLSSSSFEMLYYMDRLTHLFDLHII